jgi:hypothetical protein
MRCDGAREIGMNGHPSTHPIARDVAGLLLRMILAIVAIQLLLPAVLALAAR